MKEYNPTLRLIEIFGIVCAITLSIISLCNVQSSNQISQSALNQSFRPRGKIKTDTIKVNLDSNKYFYLAHSYILNKGPGVLNYCGNISYPIGHEIDFREMLLNNKLAIYNDDYMYSFARGSPIEKDDSFSIHLSCKSDSFYKKLYLYSLVLYKDQEGNLYDTEYLLLADFIDSCKMGVIRYQKPVFNKYNKNDKCLLMKQLIKLNPNHTLFNKVNQE